MFTELETLVVKCDQLQVGDVITRCRWGWDGLGDPEKEFAYWGTFPIKYEHRYEAGEGDEEVYTLEYMHTHYAPAHFLIKRPCTPKGEGYMRYVKGQGWVYA